MYGGYSRVQGRCTAVYGLSVADRLAYSSRRPASEPYTTRTSTLVLVAPGSSTALVVVGLYGVVRYLTVPYIYFNY